MWSVQIYGNVTINGNEEMKKSIRHVLKRKSESMSVAVLKLEIFPFHTHLIPRCLRWSLTQSPVQRPANIHSGRWWMSPKSLGYHYLWGQSRRHVNTVSFLETMPEGKITLWNVTLDIHRLVQYLYSDLRLNTPPRLGSRLPTAECNTFCWGF